MTTTVKPTWKTKLEALRSRSDDEKTWTGDFTFIQAADIQFGFIDRYLLKLPEPCWEKEIKLFTDAIKKINEMRPKPKFFVICGDMIDALPYDGPEGGPERQRQQLEAFNTVSETLDPEIPLVCVCGNHDIGDIPTRESVEIYRSHFGDDFYSFWIGGVKFVVLNSQYFKSAENVPQELDRQMALIATIKDPAAVHIVLFQHIPYFLKDADEETEYFNIEKDMRLALLDQYLEAGVRYIFTGHYHRNAGGRYKDLENVVTSAVGGPMGVDPSGFRVVQVAKDAITHEYVSTY